jgi:hypothetical protein
VVTERSYGVWIFALILLGAACSSGGGNHATSTTTNVTTPTTAVSTTTACEVQAEGSPNADLAPGQTQHAPGSSFPPADAAPPAGKSPMTAAQATDLALDFGLIGGAKPPASAATTAEVAYQSAHQSLGKSMDQRVAPNRCVWKVTVKATYEGPGGGGVAVGTVTVARPSSYSVIFDVNSGFMFEIYPGR